MQCSLPDGSVHAVFIASDATLQDLVTTLLTEEGESVAAALQAPPGSHREVEAWAIQRVIISEANRSWKDEELLDLADRELLFLDRSCSSQLAHRPNGPTDDHF